MPPRHTPAFSHSPGPRGSYHTPAFSHSPGPHSAHLFHVESVEESDETLAVQKLQAELEVAEAELKAARLKYQYLQAKEQAEQMYGGTGTEYAPHDVNN